MKDPTSLAEVMQILKVNVLQHCKIVCIAKGHPFDVNCVI